MRVIRRSSSTQSALRLEIVRSVSDVLIISEHFAKQFDPMRDELYAVCVVGVFSVGR